VASAVVVVLAAGDMNAALVRSPGLVYVESMRCDRTRGEELEQARRSLDKREGASPVFILKQHWWS
jgi:hypothetical protein